ncbi:hypothetical protein QF001_001719 [Paraburkholderia youngii]|uniref:Uncharacterized protein n=2 Tax=Paraburkholderia youngii TaxID=2782701 RepID=A0A7Y6N1D5_9BURK|nr:hypothetical protein [Paraburkholderia youngii]NUY02420.1 hypothetical protein [Paraburkholderia youngii]
MKQVKYTEEVTSAHRGWLRRLLSAHEIAALLMLACGPVDSTAATADFLALQEVGLVSMVNERFSLTDAGSTYLHLLRERR